MQTGIPDHPWLLCPDLVGHLLVKVEICKTESWLHAKERLIPIPLW